jgi:uncharacterized protein YcnI
VRSVWLIAAAGVAALLTLASAAHGHVTVQPDEAVVGSFARFVVRVPNERDAATTTKIEVRFPPLAFVSFQPKEGWKRTVTMTKLEEPIEVFGERITEAVETVTWSGGEIGPGEFDEFGFSARVPESQAVLEFAALQTYSNGELVRWIGPEDSDEPAARVSLVDIGAAEGEGELEVLAQTTRRGGDASASENPEEDDGGGGADLGVVLGGLGILLGGAALGRSLRTTR